EIRFVFIACFPWNISFRCFDFPIVRGRFHNPKGRREPEDSMPTLAGGDSWSRWEGEWGGRRSVPRNEPLLLVYEMTTAILLPASFVALCAEGLLLPVADRLDAAGVDSACHQRVFYGTGATIAQGQVVFGRAPFVAVSFDRDINVAVLTQELRVSLHRTLLIGADV